jgi:hypothetical protein
MSYIKFILYASSKQWTNGKAQSVWFAFAEQPGGSIHNRGAKFPFVAVYRPVWNPPNPLLMDFSPGIKHTET